jgi:NHL repeat-containing protein
MKPLSARWYFAALTAALTLYAQGTAFAQYTISTVASTSSAATVSGVGVAVDRAGMVYAIGSVPQAGVSGRSNTVVLGLTGAVRPVVGGSNPLAPFPGCNQPANNVGMTDLAGVAVDGSGAIYVSQSGNGPLLKVHTAATCLLVGAYFWANSITTDNVGNAYFAAAVTNQPGYAVYEATAAGARLTFAGNGSVACTGGALGRPDGLAVDSTGNLYIADSRCNVVWKVSHPGAMPVSVAGNGTSGYSGDGGPATSASLCQPRGVAVDYDGNLFITDSCNHVVREVNASTHKITTIAGAGAAGLSGDGGPALTAQLQFPWGIAVGSDGIIYVGDQVTPSAPNPNTRVRQLTPPSARMISPAPGSILPTTSVTFDWTGTSAGSQFQLDITDDGTKNPPFSFHSGPTTATTEPLSNLPCDGRTLYVQLQTFIGGQWLSPARYTYHACPMTLTVTPSALPKQGGTVTITANVANIWPENVVLTVTEALYPTPPCYRNPFTGVVYCPQPVAVGPTAQILPGTSQSVQYTLHMAPLPANYQYAVTRVFVAKLTTASGTVVFSSGAYQIQY